jgi:uncharacterized protein (DUF1015 family)
MCIINPFGALRPSPDKVAAVASHAVERYSREEISEMLKHNPFSFLHIINPTNSGLKKGEKSNIKIESIKKKLEQFTDKNIFIRDDSPCFYLYRQIKHGRHHTGIVGLASVDDYKKNFIKIHEQTLAQREEKLMEYLDVCEFNAEPVCLTYPHHKELNKIMVEKVNELPVYNFSVDGIKHTLWIINKTNEIALVSDHFKNIPHIYIADGHHRAASSARLAEMRKNSNPLHTGKEPYNFFMAALFADDELTIFSYNRLVQNLNGHGTDSFLNELKKDFDVTVMGSEVNKQAEKNILLLYMDRHWYQMVKKGFEIDLTNPVKNLDVSILSDFVLSPILGIGDIRNDKRIKFLPGIKSSHEIERIVDSGKAAAAFCLFPVTFEELISVADSGKEMPPKSTWIEPKLESGLLIYTFSEESQVKI